MIKCLFEDGHEASPGLRHAVIDALVVRDGQILLVKRSAKLVEGGKWALIGGFMDHGETIRRTVEREVMEETGWGIKDDYLFKINDAVGQPGDAARNNVVFVFVCTATEKTGEADWESDEQRWFAWSELPPVEELAFDHAQVMALYRQHLQTPRELPIFE